MKLQIHWNCFFYFPNFCDIWVGSGAQKNMWQWRHNRECF